MTDIIINTIKNVIKNPLAIYIFGSAAKGNFTNDSDIDIAILLQSPIEKHLLANIKAQLSLQLNRDVDVIDLNASSQVFQYEILSTAKKIETSDQSTVDQLEAKMLAMYLEFQDMRKDLLAEIKKKGSIYG
jgi:predicted nucleotidyltransferase